MSSGRNSLHEFQFSEAFQRREKVDAIRLWQMEEEPLKPDLKYDLRKSLAWDSAFFTSPGVLDPEELFETLNIPDLGNGVHKPEHKEQKSLPSLLFEPERASRIAECNARRSLAWDSAFFTSEGVLNPEELSIVNRGFKKSETHLLHGIKEELWRSAESNSTIDSDYSLASLEIDLLDDMRASLNKPSKAYEISIPNSKSNLQRGTSKQNSHSSKKLDASSKMKPIPASKRQSINTRSVEKIAKQRLVPPRGKLAAQTSESNLLPSVKRSKTFSQANAPATAANKRASVYASNDKTENKVRKSATGHNMSKKPCFGESGVGNPSSTPSLKSPFSCLHPALKEPAGFDTNLSNSISKSPLNSLRGKNDLRLATSQLNSRTPSRSLTRSKDELVNSNQAAQLLTTPNFAGTSPSISIDERSPGSTTTNQTPDNSSAGLDASQVTDNDSCYHGRYSVRNENKGKKLLDQNVDTISNGTTPVPSTVSRTTKPSALRMPSPKIGFFEMENPMKSTPNGGLKFHCGAESTSSKLRSGTNSLSGTSSRARHSKHQSPKTSIRNGSMKLGLPQTGVSPLSPRIRPTCSPDPVIGNECKDSSGGGYDLKVDDLQSNSGREDEDTHGIMKSKIGSEIKRQVHQIVKKDLKPNEDARTQGPENILQTTYSYDKENLSSFENQVDVLSIYIGAIDLSRDLVVEL